MNSTQPENRTKLLWRIDVGKDNEMDQSEQEGNTVSQSKSRADGFTSEWLI